MRGGGGAPLLTYPTPAPIQNPNYLRMDTYGFHLFKNNSRMDFHTFHTWSVIPAAPLSLLGKISFFISDVGLHGWGPTVHRSCTGYTVYERGFSHLFRFPYFSSQRDLCIFQVKLYYQMSGSGSSTYQMKTTEMDVGTALGTVGCPPPPVQPVIPKVRCSREGFVLQSQLFFLASKGFPLHGPGSQWGAYCSNKNITSLSYQPI